jgi:hypothetical protein
MVVLIHEYLVAVARLAGGALAGLVIATVRHEPEPTRCTNSSLTAVLTAHPI